MLSVARRLERVEALLGAQKVCPECGWPKRHRICLVSSRSPVPPRCAACGILAVALLHPYDLPPADSDDPKAGPR